MASRQLRRQRQVVSYKEATPIRKPRPLKRTSDDGRLFPVEIVDRDVANGR